MTRVQISFEGKEKFQWGYFDGETLFISGVKYTPFALTQESGMIRTPKKTLIEKLKKLGYPVDSLAESQVKWRKNNLYNLTISITNAEKDALLEYCEKRGISMYGLIRDFIRKTIGVE